MDAALPRIIATEMHWYINSDALRSPVLDTIFLPSSERKQLVLDPMAPVVSTATGSNLYVSLMFW